MGFKRDRLGWVGLSQVRSVVEDVTEYVFSCPAKIIRCFTHRPVFWNAACSTLRLLWICAPKSGVGHSTPTFGSTRPTESPNHGRQRLYSSLRLEDTATLEDDTHQRSAFGLRDE